jgi:serine/threonine protein kinase
MPAGDKPEGIEAGPARPLHPEECSLEQVVRDRGPLQVDQAVDCLIQAARELEAVHAQGTFHGHIKPGSLMLLQAGTLRVLDPGTAGFVDAGGALGNATAGGAESGTYQATIDYTAPELADDPRRADHRADTYSLGCTLYYLLTGKAPFSGDTVSERMTAHNERPAPSLRIARPDVSPALDSLYLQMVAKRAEDRPAPITEVIALLERCKTSAVGAGTLAAAPLVPDRDVKVLKEAPRQRGLPKTRAGAAIFARPRETEGVLESDALSIEDLVLNVRPEYPPNRLPAATRPTNVPAQPRKPLTTRLSRGRLAPQSLLLVAVAAVVAVGATIARIELSHKSDQSARNTATTSVPALDRPDAAPTPPPAEITTPIFDGKTRDGWMLCERNRPVPASNIQRDGLNPHGTGSYLVVYDQMVSDFVLDFDYKLTKGCNTGVFLRVSDLKLPVQTGIEVAIDDTAHGGDEDSGGFYGLVAPRVFAQRPTGEWNHMTITARGPRLSVSLNGTEVSLIDLDQWRVPGKRPDGSKHRFEHVAIAGLARTGYLGFQDLGGDCWFKNIYLTRPASAPVASPSRRVAGKTSPPRP